MLAEHDGELRLYLEVVIQVHTALHSNPPLTAEGAENSWTAERHFPHAVAPKAD